MSVLALLIGVAFAVTPVAAVSVDTKRVFLRRAIPKVGVAVTLTTSSKAYENECDLGGLIPMLDPGSKGKIKDVDESGKGSVLMHTDGGDEAWVPIRSLVGFERWSKDAKEPPPASAPAPAPAAGPAPAVDMSKTSFGYSGCHRSTEEVKDVYMLAMGMTHSRCFTHCSKQPGAKYFAVTRGSTCFCSTLSPGERTTGEHCDLACTGNKKEICGGLHDLSVYTMIRCAPPVAHEEAYLANVRSARLIDMYGYLEGQSCAQKKNNVCELNGSTKMVGTPDECKMACWDAKGSERCDGFTYNKMLSRCTFWKDVLDGRVKEREGLTCYFKKLGDPAITASTPPAPA